MILLNPGKPMPSSGNLTHLNDAESAVEGALSRSIGLPANFRSTSPLVVVERERHYFIVSSVLRELGVMDQAQHARISQSYLPKLVGREILLANLHREAPAIDPSSKVLQARVRKTESFDGETSYEYTVKLRNGSHSVTEKDEVSFQISRQEYEQLRANASKGTIIKDRFTLYLDSLIGSDQETLALEIDLPLVREIGTRIENLSILGYAMIDIEVSDRSQMELLKQGKHELSLLHCCVDISKDTDRHKLREPLSWKTLARQGVSDQVLRSVLELKQISEARLAA